MPYLITGNAQKVFHAFKQGELLAEKTENRAEIDLDLPRVPFWGTPEQAMRHYEIWSTKTSGRYYLQGDMSAGNLKFFLGYLPFIKADEDPDTYFSNFVCQDFAYVNNNGQLCGLMVMYRKDNPAQWAMGLVKNTYADPKDRELVFLSSIDPTPFLRESNQKDPVSSSLPKAKITVSLVNFSDNPLIKQVGTRILEGVLNNAIHAESGEINVGFERVQLITRKLQVQQDRATLVEPLVFSEFNLSALFAENPALDRIMRYKSSSLFLWSSILLRDLLSESRPLGKAIEALQWTEDDHLNKSLLNMVLVFYKHRLLEDNRHLLNDLAFMKHFGGLMHDEVQIKLIPFLKQQKYSDDLMRLILSDEAYFKAINMLVDLNPALTKAIPEFFKDPQKLDQLNTIHALTDDDTKRLCLLFWVKKNNFTVEDYQQISRAANQYPLLASTLVAWDQEGIVTIDQLQQWALTPQVHLQKSILHHLKEELKTLNRASACVYQLPELELEKVSQSLMLLKKSGVIDPQDYHFVLNKDSKGSALRLLLPQLATVRDEKHRKLLIDILLTEVKLGIPSQSQKVRAIQGSEQLKELATNLHQRFKCVRQLQDLGFKRNIIEFAADENDKKARLFRDVILGIMKQCKVIDERLSEAQSQSYRDMNEKWTKKQNEHRKKLYQITYDGLTQPNTTIRARLQEVEDEILTIVDPEIESDIYKALIVLANIIISTLSFGLANVIKYNMTGNFWFFNQTRSGEELRALDKKILELIAPE